MSNIAVTDEEFQVNTRIAPERMAWAVLLLSFAAFVSICVVSTLIVYYFFFESSLSLETTLRVGRGTVSVAENNGSPQAENRERSLRGNTLVRTDSLDRWSQAVISFADAGSVPEMSVIVVLKSDTSVSVHEATRPRFTWSNAGYRIDLRGLTGEIDVLVNGVSGDLFSMTVTGITGDTVLIEGNGRYVIDASDTQIRVANRRGQVFVRSADRSRAYNISEGQQGVFQAESMELTRSDYLTNVVSNDELDTGMSETEMLADQRDIPPIGWTCTFSPIGAGSVNLPLGQYRQDISPDGVMSYRLERGDNADTNGTIRCYQQFSGYGLDVTGYDYLALQAMFYVDSQSVNACGQEASECPMMLRILYKVSPDSNVVEWIHGVYTEPLSRQQEQLGWKEQCGTCLQPHIQIYNDTWYIYDTGNLFDVIPDERRPAIITQVEFFAEGHQFDVYIDGISLLARPKNESDTDID